MPERRRDPLAPDFSAQAENATEFVQDDSAWGYVYGKCCINPDTQPFYNPLSQERAWTSPIWYQLEDQ